MACFNPIHAFQSVNPNEEGKHPLFFRPPPKLKNSYLIPCGKCLGCKASLSLMWSIRCYHESLTYKQNSFLTLTYNDKSLPKNNSLQKIDLQKFFKRLRKTYKFRYFACGEYGDLSKRPHYHMVLFGRDFLEGSEQINEKLYINHHVSKVWGLGHVSIGQVTPESISYVTGYVSKKIGASAPDGLEPEFRVMSRRSGIGKEFAFKHLDDLTRTGTAVMGGKEYPIPLQYFRWLETELADVKEARRQAYSEIPLDVRLEAINNLKAKERNALSPNQPKKRASL